MLILNELEEGVSEDIPPGYQQLSGQLGRVGEGGRGGGGGSAGVGALQGAAVAQVWGHLGAGRLEDGTTPL